MPRKSHKQKVQEIKEAPSPKPGTPTELRFPIDPEMIEPCLEGFRKMAGRKEGPPAGDDVVDPVAEEGRLVNAWSQVRLRAVANELAKRRCEALNLYEPLDVAKEFHSSPAAYRMVVGANRSGKTLMAAVELARACTGRDPHGKYTATGGSAFIVGKDQRHLGQVIYDKLFRAGSFRIIRDRQTGAWRALRPWLAEDHERASRGEAKLAPPLIPRRYIESISWEKKAENVPAKISLVTGWELFFYSSLGKPPQGSSISLF